MTGRRELVAALGGAILGVLVSLFAGPGIGVIVGGMGGPLIGLLVPRREGDAEAALGTPRSAERYSMPGSHLKPGTHRHAIRADPPRDDEEGLP